MATHRHLFGKAAALTAIISAATGLMWAAIAYFNKKDTTHLQPGNPESGEQTPEH